MSPEPVAVSPISVWARSIARILQKVKRGLVSQLALKGGDRSDSDARVISIAVMVSLWERSRQV